MMNIKMDSRKVKPGDTFVALRGIDGDGHNYIDDAIKRGATKIITEEGNYAVETVIVEDTRLYTEQYLYDNYQYLIDEMTIIGVTGTNGKTTTCFLLYQALNMYGIKTGYSGTIGYYLDKKISDSANATPDLLEIYSMLFEAYENGFKTFIIESSSHGLTSRRLENIFFDYAIFTNLTNDHLDYHITMDNYALGKQLLFKKLKKNGIAIINSDSEYKDYFLLDNINKTYGFSTADYQVIDYKLYDDLTIFKFLHNKKEYNCKSKMIGKYNIYNMMAMIVVLDNMGLDMKKIKHILIKLNTPVGRLDNIKHNINNIIIDYAHTPDAIENVLKTVLELNKGNIYVVFGCTGDRDRYKRPVMAKIVTDLAKYAIITNDDPHLEDPNQIIDDMIKGIKNNNYEVILDRKEAIIKGINLLKNNDILLILGKGHEEYMIIGKDKLPFNDYKVVTEYLKTVDK